MAQLNSGVLIKLLEDISIDEKEGSDDYRKPELLQISSIIPLLAEGDLWPSHGFYLKVSDLSHSIYASMSQQDDEMILCNKLQLGQYIYVEKLEAAYPVPMLKGVTIIPGRHSCNETTKELITVDSLVRIPKDSCFSSSSKVRLNYLTDSDDESTITTASSSMISIGKRRSWNGMEFTRGGEVSDSSVGRRNKMTPIARSRSASISPVHRARYDSSDDNSVSKIRRKIVNPATKSDRIFDKSRICESADMSKESVDSEELFSTLNDKKSRKIIDISWDTIPPPLVNIGKEVLRHRDVALQAAVEALQEASAAERLLNCLSTYSELQLDKDVDHQQQSVDKFFNLQDNLAQTQLILQSLTNISPLHATNTESISQAAGSIGKALKLASDRKKNATSWIKAAVASDLNPSSAPNKLTTIPTKTTSTTRKTRTSRISKPNGSFLVKKQRNHDEIQIGSVVDNPPNWVKGPALNAASELAHCLQDECRNWFLIYIKKYLDEVKMNTMSMESSDSHVSELMHQIKRVNDWLDLMVKRESLSSDNKESPTLEDSDLEAYGRVRDKIYEVLLQHVERTTIAR